MTNKAPNRYPKGWNLKTVQDLIAQSDSQTADETIAEAEAAYRKRTAALVEVPVAVLPRARRLLHGGG